MKKLQLTLLTLALGISGAFAQGADAFGYTFKTDTSLKPGAPTYQWVDIADAAKYPSRVKVVGLGDDNGVGMFPIGFPFHYYFSDYSKVQLGVNGWISFNSKCNLRPTFAAIPTPGGQGDDFISAWESDLNFAGDGNPGELFYWTNNVDSFVVTYSKVPYWVRATEYSINANSTFQIILCGKDSSITINYNSIAADQTASGTQAGIENVSGQSGLRVLNNQVPAFKTVKFYYPKTTTLVTKDVATKWNQNEDNSGFFVVKGNNPITLRANVKNVGNADVNTVTVSGRVKKGSTFANLPNPVAIPSLAVGKDSTVTLSTAYIADKAGSYTYEVTSNCASDAFSGNNKSTSEMIAVDTTSEVFHLNYATTMEEEGGSVFGLGGACAVYVEPPFYPFYITGVEAFFSEQGNVTPGDPLPGGYSFQIHSGNSNAVGTLLHEQDVPEEETINLGLNSADIMIAGKKSFIKVTSGGVYLTIASDSTVNVNSDVKLPFSFRTYEVLSGIYASYRQGDAEDLQMGFVGKKQPDTVKSINSPRAERYVLANFPNPAKDFTTVSFKLIENAEVKVVVRNMLGQVVESVDFGSMTADSYQKQINTASYNNGMYSYTLVLDGKPVDTKRMIVVK